MNYRTIPQTAPVADKDDAKRWLIVGAHKAGANDRKIARMCGVSQANVRRIILNFQKTGSPHLHRGLSHKERTRPFVEYDSQGNLIDSEDENEEEQDGKKTTGRPRQSSLKQAIRARKPSAKDLIAYVLNKAQQSEKSNKHFVKHEEDEKWRPPTPPRDPLQQSDANQQIRTNADGSIPSPPTSEASISPKPKYESIRGYETWTIDDDKVLMAHVLSRLSGCRWKEAEAKLRGKHSAELCEKRWEVLRNLLIRGAEKSGTRGW